MSSSLTAAQAARTRAPVVARVVGTGLAATLVAAATTTLLAAGSHALGVDLEVPAGGEQIPVVGVGVMTALLSLVGVTLAAALLRWSAHPARWFVRVTLSLTAISLLPPLLVGADVATTATLVALHLVAAAVVVPALARALTRSTGGPGSPVA